MALGRPPSNSLSYVDCEFPEDDTTTINDKGEVEMGCKVFFASSSPPLNQLASFPLEALFHKRRIHTGAPTYTHCDATDLRNHLRTRSESSGESPPSFIEFIPLQLY